MLPTTHVLSPWIANPIILYIQNEKNTVLVNIAKVLMGCFKSMLSPFHFGCLFPLLPFVFLLLRHAQNRWAPCREPERGQQNGVSECQNCLNASGCLRNWNWKISSFCFVPGKLFVPVDQPIKTFSQQIALKGQRIPWHNSWAWTAVCAVTVSISYISTLWCNLYFFFSSCPLVSRNGSKTKMRLWFSCWSSNLWVFKVDLDNWGENNNVSLTFVRNGPMSNNLKPICPFHCLWKKGFNA